MIHVERVESKSVPSPFSSVMAVLVVSLCWAGLSGEVWAQKLEYNRDIRPILAENCFACHGADSAARQGDLRLDQREAALEMQAIVPGKPEEGELLARILTDDADVVMPPPETKKSLTAEEKELLKRWIEQGAEYQPHWSFLSPVKAEPATAADHPWVKTPIDRFILDALTAAGLEPAPTADARTLFRRLHLDITGLPAVPEEIEKFVVDYSTRGDAALSEWIDQLMQRPSWGEHRGRYWLDAARYADTHGLHFDNYREMWLYRDWVIKAFNANQPFDQFTIEQLAGDLLPNPTESQLIATGFQRCNITTNEGGTIDEENVALYATDRVQTFGWVYLGLTTNCCQCHDHKFDPISMQDYYSLAAYFRNTTQRPKDGNVKDGLGPVIIVPSDADRPRWEVLPEEIRLATQRREEYRKSAQPQYEAWLAQLTPEILQERLPTRDLLAHLPLNEGTGSEVSNQAGDDETTFTVDGEVSWVEGGKFGAAPVVQAGKTFNLGGLGDFERDQSFSISVWVKPSNNSASAAIVGRMDEAAAHRGWDLWQNGNAFSVHIIDNWPDNAVKVTTTNPVVKTGEWQHLLATYDGSGKPGGVKIYWNGEEQPVRVDQNTLKADASIRTQTPLRIGQRSTGAVLEGGAVQDLRLYATRLNASEVKAIADLASLREILLTETDKRSDEQRKTLFEHYLTVHDSDYPQLAEQVTKLEGEREAIRGRSPVTHIQEERKDTPAMAHILMRGEYDRPGEQVAAAPPQALHPLPADAPANRLGLAQWVVDPANPLTARVTVNRFWQEVFGVGIVETAEDFGVMGSLPTHPELLDWLALDFQDQGWDVQRFFKQIFMSAAYRQSSEVTPEKLELDRANLLLSRGPRFRMDAEMIRDQALAASGLLADKMFGPGVKPYQPTNIWDIVGLPGGNTRNYVQDSGQDLYRRTVYTFWKRMAPPPNLEALNAPSREVCVVRRERTNTPLQALVTLNDPIFVESARTLAQSALMTTQASVDETLQIIARRVLGRDFLPAEIAILAANQASYLSFYESHPEDAQGLISVGESKPTESLAPPLLAAWTLVCNQVLNLDETLNK